MIKSNTVSRQISGLRSISGVVLLSLSVTALPGALAQERTASSATDILKLDGALEMAGSLPRLHSLLISRDGELLVEEYFNGRSASSVANIKSASKSVLSALIGIAINEGYIKGVDQPIGDFFGEQLEGESNRTKRNITVGNLLTMQSGLETTSNRNYGAWVQSRDWVGFALNQRLERPPGTLMEYSTGNTHLLSAILTIATANSTLVFAREALGQPLGFYLAQWPRDPTGIYFGGNDMEFTARQMMAFGELYMNDGMVDGRQIISAEWVADSLQPRAISTRESGRYYGYGWWLREMAGHVTPYAWGYGGQFIVLVPDLELVVVTTSSSLPSDARRPHLRQLFDLFEFLVVAPLSDRANSSTVFRLP